MQRAMSVAGTSAIPYDYWCIIWEWRIGGEREDRRHINTVSRS
jgi:hypothetical protein